jgi:replicative DNA helicase
VSLDRLPPHNAEAEEAILGSVLLDREVIRRLSGRLAPRDFYRERNATIYEAMASIDARDGTVDYLTLIDELDRAQRLAAVGGTTYVAGLLGAVPTPIHAEHYAKIVASCAFMRRLMSAGGKIATLGFQNECPPSEALARCEEILAGVVGEEPSDLVLPLEEGVRRYLDRLSAIADLGAERVGVTYRIPTTYRDLDRLLGGGMGRGDLILLAGRPGMGKSALALEILARSALAFEIPSLIFSMEMGALQLVSRMVAARSGVPIATLESTRLSLVQERKLGEAVGALADLTIGVCEVAALTLATLRSEVRRYATANDLALVVVDHIQLLSASGENRVAEMGVISRGLKAIARDYNVAVLALAQLSRAVEQRADKHPVMSDLRESGSLEQDADVVMTLYRDEVYNPATERAGLVDLGVIKHRNGPTGNAVFVWNPETTGFQGLEYYDRQQS